VTPSWRTSRAKPVKRGSWVRISSITVSQPRRLEISLGSSFQSRWSFAQSRGTTWAAAISSNAASTAVCAVPNLTLILPLSIATPSLIRSRAASVSNRELPADHVRAILGL